MSENPDATAGERRRGPVRRAAPGPAVLAGYRRSWLRGDLLAGVTVAAYLVPQVMAYAGLAGLPPVAGLWAMILPALLLYTLLGSSRLLSVGPESTTAPMTATVVGPLAAGAPDRYATPAAWLAVVVGAMLLVAWVARLRFLADLLSRPILVYLTSMALIIIVDCRGGPVPYLGPTGPSPAPDQPLGRESGPLDARTVERFRGGPR